MLCDNAHRRDGLPSLPGVSNYGVSGGSCSFMRRAVAGSPHGCGQAASHQPKPPAGLPNSNTTHCRAQTARRRSGCESLDASLCPAEDQGVHILGVDRPCMPASRMKPRITPPSAVLAHTTNTSAMGELEIHSFCDQSARLVTSRSITLSNQHRAVARSATHRPRLSPPSACYRQRMRSWPSPRTSAASHSHSRACDQSMLAGVIAPQSSNVHSLPGLRRPSQASQQW